MLLYVLRCVAIMLVGPWFIVLLLPWYFRYHTLKYRFDEEGIAMSWGILWRREIYLTYARIQDIHLSRGLFERWLGLATIHVQTAAGTAGAEMSIEGLSKFESVRDFLYSRMRGAHVAPHAAEGTFQSQHAGDAVLVLLGEIRDELRALRTSLPPREAP